MTPAGMIAVLVTDAPNERDSMLRRLVDAAARGNYSAACPDPNQLAGFVEGRLSAQERSTVEAHLGTCDRCAEVVAALAGEDADARPVVCSSRKWQFLGVVAAAALIAALGLWWWLPGGTPTVTIELLAQTASRLAAARPDLLADLRPLRAEELADPGSGAVRGDLAITAPAGKLLATQPDFDWPGEPSVQQWTLVVSAADANELWRVQVPAPPVTFPADKPQLSWGTSYLCAVEGESAQGMVRSSRAFAVASAAEVLAFRQACEAIKSGAAPAQGGLLQAHLAVRRGFWGEAERLLRVERAREPAERLVALTLLHVLRLTGSPAADRLAAELSGAGR
ncbi:MAG TPA: zf-HC2 domain-containing protein [Planctomycetota bacterium]|nr:zf-HC2 domain-containing protein [Planctomycetota bacterium]